MEGMAAAGVLLTAGRCHASTRRPPPQWHQAQKSSAWQGHEAAISGSPAAVATAAAAAAADRQARCCRQAAFRLNSEAQGLLDAPVAALASGGMRQAPRPVPTRHLRSVALQHQGQVRLCCKATSAAAAQPSDRLPHAVSSAESIGENGHVPGVLQVSVCQGQGRVRR